MIINQCDSFFFVAGLKINVCFSSASPSWSVSNMGTCQVMKVECGCLEAATHIEMRGLKTLCGIWNVNRKLSRMNVNKSHLRYKTEKLQVIAERYIKLLCAQISKLSDLLSVDLRALRWNEKQTMESESFKWIASKFWLVKPLDFTETDYNNRSLSCLTSNCQLNSI